MDTNGRRKAPTKDFLAANLHDRFDGVFAFAFIHLFPHHLALQGLKKIHAILNPGGIFYVGSTNSIISKEGYEIKKDYDGEHQRYRKHWTREELELSLRDAGFEILDHKDFTDPFGKVWMDFIGRKP